MFFHEVLEGPPDPVFGLVNAFQADVRPKKVDLMVGIYRDEQLRSELFPSVRKSKEQITAIDSHADYLPIDGYPVLVDVLGALILGKSSWEEARGRIYGAHMVGGTGALRIGAEFLAQEVSQAIVIPKPTWPNHRMIFERAGCKVEEYPYYDREKRRFDFSAMCQGLNALPEKTAVVLHGCCHNPTGCDPSLEEWKEISQLMRKKKLIPFFDFAYQGLGDGIEQDAEAIRLFVKEGHELLIAYSCSKNFSLYSARVGALFVIDENVSVKLRVGSQIKRIIRATYSNPPSHGAYIVGNILQHPNLKVEWERDLNGVRNRITQMQKNLAQKLIAKAKKTNFEYLRGHKGIFSFIDLDKRQVQKLIDEYAIYLLGNGRINVSGLTAKNIDYVVDSIISVCES
ncbi:MAG TPA: aromatic amino acid transaminase [Chlamydiales bacterium]|nr:aromatic amino acid transaminase [Chlamydiales bacterium]